MVSVRQVVLQGTPRVHRCSVTSPLVPTPAAIGMGTEPSCTYPGPSRTYPVTLDSLNQVLSPESAPCLST